MKLNSIFESIHSLLSIHDVFVAFVGGAAGALEISRKDRGTVISGVAIVEYKEEDCQSVASQLTNWISERLGIEEVSVFDR